MAIIASSAFINSLQHLIGFAVVVLALTILWLITASLGKLFLSLNLQPTVHDGSPPAGGSGEGAPSDEEVAAIAACVAALVGRRSRIVSIRRQRKTDWNREGRRELFSSKNIR